MKKVGAGFRMQAAYEVDNHWGAYVQKQTSSGGNDDEAWDYKAQLSTNYLVFRSPYAEFAELLYK